MRWQREERYESVMGIIRNRLQASGVEREQDKRMLGDYGQAHILV